MTIIEGITIILGIAGYVSAFTLAVILAGKALQRPKIFINYATVTIVVFAYASSIWLGVDNQDLVSLDVQKPYVYRQLIPILARVLDWVMPLDWAIVLLVTLSGAGFYHALRKLESVFHPINDRTDLYLLGSVFVGLALFNDYFMIYDLATAFLFTLALGYLVDGQYNKYLLLFPVICLNRETAILLTVLCCVILYYKKDRDFEFIALQVFVWVTTQIILRSIFANNPGVPALIEPLENLQKFISYPLITSLHLAVTVLILYFVFRGWNHKPLFLRLAFATFAPLLFVAYIVMGQAYEVRIFWELFPVAVLLALPTVVK